MTGDVARHDCVITVSRIYGVHHCIKDLPCIVSRIYYVHHCIKDLPCTVSRIYRVHHCIKDLPSNTSNSKSEVWGGERSNVPQNHLNPYKSVQQATFDRKPLR